MATWFDKATLAGAAALMLTGLSTTAQGFSGPSASPAVERLIQIKGNVICTGCRLEDVQKTPLHRQKSRLYQLSTEQGPVVMEVEAVNKPAWLNAVLVPHLRVRGGDEQLQKLSAPESVTKEIEISGIAADTRTLDVYEVVVKEGSQYQSKRE